MRNKFLHAKRAKRSVLHFVGTLIIVRQALALVRVQGLQSTVLLPVGREVTAGHWGLGSWDLQPGDAWE